jgi:ClpP class serine protease
MYELKNKLNFNNCIIIYNKPDVSYINKISIMIFEYILNEYIFDINDYTNIIKKLKDNKNINIILNTHGGDISSNDILINFIQDSKINITGYVYKKSQSAGTIIALISNKLYIKPEAILSPTDAQITIDGETYSIKSIINMCEEKDKNYISDKYLINYYENKKLHYENLDLVDKLIQNKLKKNISKQKKLQLIYELTSGDYSHHRPISGLYLNKFLDVNLDFPKNIDAICKLYEIISY